MKKEKVTYSIELNLTIISIETGPETFLPAAPIKINIFAGIPEERWKSPKNAAIIAVYSKTGLKSGFFEIFL